MNPFKSHFLFTFALLALFLLPFYVAGSEFEEKVVAKIDIIIEKNSEKHSIDANSIRSMMKTKVGSKFSPLQFDQDLKALAKQYETVEPDLELINNQVYVRLTIIPKPLIESITFTGNAHITSIKLIKELGIKLNTPFNSKTFTDAIQKLKRYYVKKGFFEASIHYALKKLDSNDLQIEITVDEGRAGKINDIIFKGFSDEEEEALIDQLHTKTYSLFTSWLTDTGNYSQEIIDADKHIILDYLQNLGYADAKLNIEIEPVPHTNKINLLLIAEKGEPFTIGTINITGNSLFTLEQIKKAMIIAPGNVYSTEAILKTINSIKMLYGSKGYIDCSVSFDPLLVEGKNEYDINIVITEGLQYRVGLIKVFGNTVTQTPVILHECSIVPGQIFDSRRMKNTEDRLNNLNYFKVVSVYAVRSKDDLGLGPNYKDVYIEVEEASTGNFSFSIGFSNQKKLSTNLQLIERNFNYKGFSKLFSKGLPALRGGGEYARIQYRLGTKELGYGISFLKPHAFDTNWTTGFDIGHSDNRYMSKKYSLKSDMGRLRAFYGINNFLTFGVHYRIKAEHWKVISSDDLRLRRQAEASKGVVSAVGVSLAYDSTNHPMEPTRGLMSDFRFEFAGLGGRHHFLSMGYINSYYHPVAPKLVLKLRGDLQFVSTYNRSKLENIPLGERLFMGGEDSVRGYRYDTIGPKFDALEPKGGLSSFLVSSELLYKLHKKFDFFTFIDSGMVSEHAFSFDTMRTAAGFGLRIEAIPKTPKVIIGIGFPINPKSRSDVKKFFFSFSTRF